MSFLPTSYWILIGTIGLVYLLAVACLVLGCLKLHRVEGTKAWRIASYAVILQSAVVLISTLATIGSIFFLISHSAVDTMTWLETLAAGLDFSSTLLGWVVLGALAVALGSPLRKKKSSITDSGC